MKVLIEQVLVNDKYQDAVIEYHMGAQKDDRGKIIYTDPGKCIGITKGNIDAVVVYVKDDNDYSTARVIKISAYSIKKIYAHILEIEQLENEDFID